MITSKVELEEAKVRSRVDAQALREAWCEVLASPQGRRVLDAVILSLRGGSVFRISEVELYRLAALHDAADALERDVLNVSPENGRLLLEERIARRITEIQLGKLSETSKR